MSTASGIRVGTGYVAETTPNVQPSSPTLKAARFIQRNINPEKNLLESAEVQPHGEEIDVRHGFTTVNGAFTAELSTGGQDDFIEASLGGTWSSPIAISAATASLTAPATVTMTTTGVQAGDFIRLAGFATASNNGLFMVLTVAVGSLTVATPAAAPLTTQSGGTVTLTGRRVSTGTTQKSFTVEQSFPDINQFRLFNGVELNGFTCSIQPEQLVNLSFPVIGMTPKPFTTSSIYSSFATNYAATGQGYSAAATGSPYDAFSGAIVEGSGNIAVVTGLEFTNAMNRTTQSVVGSRFTPDIYEARKQVSGTITFMLQDATLYNKFFNETETKIGVAVADPNGIDYHSVFMPRVKLNAAPIEPGQTGPILVSTQFRALRDIVNGRPVLTWYRSNAS